MSKVYIRGSAGRLEGMYHQSAIDGAPTALLLHPHSLYGGTMNNKIIFGVFKLYVKHGFSVLRMNFRGVGRSDGKFDNGIGEIMDAQSGLNWLQEYNINSKQHWVVGFSFGSYITLQMVARRPEISNFVCLSCPASKYNLSFLNPCSRRGLVLQGEKDKIAKAEDTKKFISQATFARGGEMKQVVIPDANHFFTGHENKVYSTVEKYIKSIQTSDSSKKIKISSKIKKGVPMYES